jgi:hypothetical protein
MAIVKFTAIVDEIRGSIGGTTFQRNAYGWSIKRKPNIIRPNTLRQQVSKTSFGSITRYWSTLSQVNRDSWDTYASTYPIPSIKNPSVDITGFNYFVKYHLIKFTTGSRSFLDNATAAAGTLTFTSFVLESDNLSWFQLVFDYVSSSDLFISLFFLSPPLEDSRVVPRLTPLYIDSSLPTSSVSTARTVDISLAATYNDLYNTIPVVGSSVVVRIPSYNTVSGALDFLSEFRVQVVYGNAIKAVTAAYFKLDDLTGPVIDSAQGNDGTNFGATRGVTGKIDDCFSFNGSTDYVDIDSILPTIASTTQGTWNVWVKPTSAISPLPTQFILSFSATNSPGAIGVVMFNNGVVRGELNDNLGTLWFVDTNTSVLSVGTWSMITLVQNGVTPKLYIDGVNISQTVTGASTTEWFSDVPTIDNGRLAVLDFNGNGKILHFEGDIDEVGIFNTALTSTQITELYNSGTGLSYPF